MGGNKWCPEDCVDQETIGARELSGTLSLANATIANATYWPASAFSLVKFVCQPVYVHKAAT